MCSFCMQHDEASPPSKRAKTNRILIHPDVASQFFAKAVRHPRNEIGALLLGRVRKDDVVVEKMIFARQIGSAIEVEFSGRDFQRALRRAKGKLLVVGWAHSHPTYGCFLSPIDKRFQTQGQGLFSEWVALVMDPFAPRGIEFQTFRVEKGGATAVPHAFLEEGKRHAA